MRDKLAQWVARWLPRRVVYHAAVRLGAHATTGVHGTTEAPALRFMDALARWEQRR